jgi:hypothetical protein
MIFLANLIEQLLLKLIFLIRVVVLILCHLDRNLDNVLFLLLILLGDDFFWLWLRGLNRYDLNDALIIFLLFAVGCLWIGDR